jgi:hypothetical protein
MDDSRFDALTKTLGTTHTRRGVARLLGGLGLGGVLSALGTSEALAAARKGGVPCTRKSQCKTGRCVGPAGNKQCSCSKKFRAYVQPAGPCKQATCDLATKLCVTWRSRPGRAHRAARIARGRIAAIPMTAKGSVLPIRAVPRDRRARPRVSVN